MAEKKYAYWIKSGFFTGLQRFSIIAFGIINFSILARALNKEEMGTWALFLMITAIIESSKNSLIKNGMIRYINCEPREKHSTILSSSLILNIFITVFIIILIVIFINPLSNLLHAPHLKSMMDLFLIGLLAMIPFSHFEFVQNAYFDFHGIFWSYLVRQGFLCLLIVADLVFSNAINLDKVVGYYVVGILAGTIVSFLFARKFLTKRFVPTMQWVKELWRYGRFVFGTGLSGFILRGTDQFIVAPYFSPAVVALYNASVRVTNLVDIPSTVLSEILFPKSAKTSEEGNASKVKFLYEKTVGAVLSVSIPAIIFIYFFSKFILVLLAGKQYIEAVPILQVTIAYGLFLPFIRQFGIILDSIGKPQKNFIVNISIAILNIINNIIFIHLFGILGAAYGTLVSYVIFFVVTQVVLYKELKVSIKNSFKYAINFYPEIYRLIEDRLVLR